MPAPTASGYSSRNVVRKCKRRQARRRAPTAWGRVGRASWPAFLATPTLLLLRVPLDGLAAATRGVVHVELDLGGADDLPLVGQLHLPLALHVASDGERDRIALDLAVGNGGFPHHRAGRLTSELGAILLEHERTLHGLAAHVERRLPVSGDVRGRSRECEHRHQNE